VLDSVVLRERSQLLAGGRVAGISAQARGGAFALLELVCSLPAPTPADRETVAFVWLAQTQFGAKGLAVALRAYQPQRVLVLGQAGGRLEKTLDAGGHVGRFGEGVVVASSDAVLHDIARKTGMKVQLIPDDQLAVGVAPGVARGSEVHVAALPVLFPRTPVETVDIDEIDGLIALAAGFAGLELRSAVPLSEQQPRAKGTGETRTPGEWRTDHATLDLLASL